MLREFSAGGVVVRQMRGKWFLAAIQPCRTPAEAKPKAAKPVLALPKGNVDPGEKPEQTAIREVREETGIEASLVRKLGDIKYVYVRSWAQRERVFKIVSFYLLRYRSGRLGNIAPEMQHEVSCALWLPLETAVQQLAYRGEREMVKLAKEYLSSAAASAG